MKKLVITGLATVGLALGAFGQGAVVLDNSTAAQGITGGTTNSGAASTFYNGAAGVQIWYLNGVQSASIAAINAQAANPLAAYAMLTADGFTLATSFYNTQIGGGGFTLGTLLIPGVTPAGSTVTMAVAAWEGAGTAYGTAQWGGVLAFDQPTANYNAVPPPTVPDLTGSSAGFNTANLVLAPIPEPATFALAGLGAASLLIFRRRK